MPFYRRSVAGTALIFRAACGVLLLVTIACSGFKDYRSATKSNLLIRTTLSGSTFTKVTARLHLYALRGVCDRRYLGTVPLTEGEIRIGLPQETTYLEFMFVTSARFGGSTATVPYAVVLTPRAGGEYVAEVGYQDRAYSVIVYEGARPGTTNRVIERHRADCS